jgi:putative toxin-antitoxin system antitoxin component (TIGR02293 family)
MMMPAERGTLRETKPSRKAAKVRSRAGTRSGALIEQGVQPASRETVIRYVSSKGVDHFILLVSKATPMQLVDVERRGVDGRFVKGLSAKIGIPAVRLFSMLGVPKATVEKRAATGGAIAGSGGQAAVAMARLIAKAEEIVAGSTAPGAKEFDAAKWLGQWLERPQPALGGRRPSELIGTPTGAEVVNRLLGAMESGAYQ